jgi:hypothetical protein
VYLDLATGTFPSSFLQSFAIHISYLPFVLNAPHLILTIFGEEYKVCLSLLREFPHLHVAFSILCQNIVSSTPNAGFSVYCRVFEVTIDGVWIGDQIC